MDLDDSARSEMWSPRIELLNCCSELDEIASRFGERS